MVAVAGTATANVPSARVVADATGRGASPFAASRRASASGGSYGDRADRDSRRRTLADQDAPAQLPRVGAAAQGHGSRPG